MEITSKPLALDEIDRRVLQLEMERLSLSKAAPSDKCALPLLAAPSCLPSLAPLHHHVLLATCLHITAGVDVTSIL